MIKNRRDGYHYNSPYWQNYKKNLPELSSDDTQFQIAVGMVFGDATMGKRSREAYIKFEQGYKQKEFVISDHLFEIFGKYTFVDGPQIRVHPDSSQKKSKVIGFEVFPIRLLQNSLSYFINPPSLLLFKENFAKP
jgi:hypothetical protein